MDYHIKQNRYALDLYTYVKPQRKDSHEFEGDQEEMNRRSRREERDGGNDGNML